MAQTKLALDSFDKQNDDENIKQKKLEDFKLRKKKEELERTLEAFNKSAVSRLDGKSQKQFDYYTQELTNAKAKLEREIKEAKEAFEKYEKHLNTNITRLTGNQEVIDPERITRVKMEIKDIDSKISFNQLFLEAVANIEASGKTCVTMLPEKSWVIDPIKEALAIAELEKRKVEGEGWVFDPEA